MALASTSAFASFDITDGSQARDISPLLQDALFFDLHLLGNINVAFDDPVDDIIYYWNEDALNSDTVTTSASAAASATTLVLSAGHGLRVHVGDLVKDTAAGSTEVKQVTAIATDTLTLAAGVNSTTGSSIASGATLALLRAEQESSDIGTDVSVAPTVRSNYSHIVAGKFELVISGTQLARGMATTALNNQVAHQLANRMTEFKINLTRIALYSERVGPGSDTQYRSLGGIRYWIRDNGGVNYSTPGALSLSVLNARNKTIVDRGEYPDLLVVGTDLVDSINGIDSGNRRMLESDRKAGYVVQEILLGQGNSVRVVVDGRVGAGDAFLLCGNKFKLRPMAGRGMFTIAAVDFADAKKRRILGEWGMEFRNPSVHAYLSNQT